MLFNTQKVGRSLITDKKAGFSDISYFKYKSFYVTDDMVCGAEYTQLQN